MITLTPLTSCTFGSTALNYGQANKASLNLSWQTQRGGEEELEEEGMERADV